MKRKVCESDFVKFDETPLKRQPFAPINHSAMYSQSSPAPGALPRARGASPAAGPGPSPTAEAELRRVMDNFVGIYEQLDTCSGADVKPNYSYTELAYLAMLRSPNFCLPITEIYRYIQSRFLFFKNSTRKHWKNAVRHSLAKTLCFSKIPVGRGTSNSETLSRSTYLWCILPNSISSFARGDYRPSVDRDSGTNTLRWGYYRVNAGKFWDEIGNYVGKKMLDFKKALLTSTDQARIFETQVCSLPDSRLHQPPVLPRQPPPPYPQQRQHTRQSPYQSTPNGHSYTQCSMNGGRQKIREIETSPTSAVHQFNPASPQLGTYIASGNCGGRVGQSTSPVTAFQGHDAWIPKIEMPDIDTNVSAIDSGRITPPFVYTDRLTPQCHNTTDRQFATPEHRFTTPDPHLHHYGACERLTPNSVTSDPRTPPLTSFEYGDSGIETCTSSPENNSYDEMPSCRQIISCHSSPIPPVTFDKLTEESCFDNLQLSPLVDSGFLNISDILPHSFSQSQTSDSGCSSLNFDSPCASNGFQYQYVMGPSDYSWEIPRDLPVTNHMLQGIDPMLSDAGLPNF